MEVLFRVHPWHPVKFIEDLKVDREKEELCRVCEDLALGPGYKCCVCSFLCHQSCATIPSKVEHPLHPNHTLEISLLGYNTYCDACNKSCKRCCFYSCNECEFNLDTKCVSRLKVNKDDGHQHTFVPLFKQVQFTCEGCGGRCKDMGFVCSKCQLLTHNRCTLFIRTIKIAGHEHFLTLSYFIQKVKEQIDIVCEVCFEKVNTKYAAYYCQHCSYVVHLKCAKDCLIEEDRDATNDSASNSINQLFGEGYLLGLIKDMNQTMNVKDQPKKIQHFSHPHDLILNQEKVSNNKVCDACMQLISIPCYSCVNCNYFLHSLCAIIPKKLTLAPRLLPTNFIVLSQAPTPDGVFKCSVCDHYRHGFACTIDAEDLLAALGFTCTTEMEVPSSTFFMCDIQCLKLEKFQHKGHQHLFVARDRPTICKFCGKKTTMVCSQGEFALCERCITLPLVISYKDDEHPLELTYKVEDTSGEHYCLICERKRNLDHWFYYCTRCNFAGHPQCVLGEFSYIKIGKTYKDERHQHPLTFVQKTNDSHLCDICGLTFGDMFLQCEECRLNIHPKFGFKSSDCLRICDAGEALGEGEELDEINKQLTSMVTKLEDDESNEILQQFLKSTMTEIEKDEESKKMLISMMKKMKQAIV